MTRSKLKVFLNLLRMLVLGILSVGLLAAATWSSVYLMTNEARTPRQPPPRVDPMVEVRQVGISTEQVVLTVMGTVIPAVTVDLQAEVSGRIIAKHPDFVEGGTVEAGEILVEIDPRDYEHALTTRLAQLEAAQADLKIEQGQQEVAQREWEIFDQGTETEALDRELALRQPQLRRRQADLEAAQALVEQAKLDLERTKVRAPFNAVIQAANIDVGDQALPQRMLARLVGTDVFWVRATVPVDEFKWIEFPSEGRQGSLATVFSTTGAERSGRVFKLLTDIDPQGNMARILIEVPDPLTLDSANADELPLLLDEQIRVAIEGRTVPNVTRLTRDMIRDGHQVWTVDAQSKLHFIEPEMVWLGEEFCFCRGIPDGTQVVVSGLTAPVDGMGVMLPGAEQAPRTGPAGPGAGGSRPGGGGGGRGPGQGGPASASQTPAENAS